MSSSCEHPALAIPYIVNDLTFVTNHSIIMIIIITTTTIAYAYRLQFQT